MLLARPVVAASSVKVTEPGECTTSVRSLAARFTACVPLGLVTSLPRLCFLRLVLSRLAPVAGPAV